MGQKGGAILAGAGGTGQPSWGRNPRGQAETVCRREGILGGGEDEREGVQVGPNCAGAGNRGRLRERVPGL